MTREEILAVLEKSKLHAAFESDVEILDACMSALREQDNRLESDTVKVVDSDQFKTNADHIRSMTDEELAVFLECFGGCHYCSEYETAMFGNDGILDCDGDCERHILDWLREAYKEDT